MSSETSALRSGTWSPRLRRERLPLFSFPYCSRNDSGVRVRMSPEQCAVWILAASHRGATYISGLNRQHPDHHGLVRRILNLCDIIASKKGTGTSSPAAQGGEAIHPPPDCRLQDGCHDRVVKRGERYYKTVSRRPARGRFASLLIPKRPICMI